MEAFPSRVVGSLLLLDEFTTPVHQEQIAAEQLVHVALPQNLEQMVEGVKEILEERFPEQTVEQRVGIPVAAAHAAPSPVNEYVAPAPVVGFSIQYTLQ